MVRLICWFWISERIFLSPKLRNRGIETLMKGRILRQCRGTDRSPIFWLRLVKTGWLRFGTSSRISRFSSSRTAPPLMLETEMSAFAGARPSLHNWLWLWTIKKETSYKYGTYETKRAPSPYSIAATLRASTLWSGVRPILTWSSQPAETTVSCAGTTLSNKPPSPPNSSTRKSSDSNGRRNWDPSIPWLFKIESKSTPWTTPTFSAMCPNGIESLLSRLFAGTNRWSSTRRMRARNWLKLSCRRCLNHSRHRFIIYWKSWSLPWMRTRMRKRVRRASFGI